MTKYSDELFENRGGTIETLTERNMLSEVGKCSYAPSKKSDFIYDKFDHIADEAEKSVEKAGDKAEQHFNRWYESDKSYFQIMLRNGTHRTIAWSISHFYDGMNSVVNFLKSRGSQSDSVKRQLKQWEIRENLFKQILAEELGKRPAAYA